MKILLIDIDSTISNLALKKVEKFYIDKGDEVIWNYPFAKYEADKIYVSCIFPENKGLCYEWEGIAEIGGTGYDIKKTLPEEIENVKPKINYGFTTRGCPRRCFFCFVPMKEGNIRVIGDIYDLWDGMSKELIIMDNNILALPEHFFKIAGQLKKEKLKVDFNQGLDHRLVTDEIAKELLSLNHKKEIRFAFDDIAYKKTVLKALEILRRNGMKDWKTRWYVYVSEKDTYETAFERLELLRTHKQLAYLMRDRKVYDRPEYQALACWCGEPGSFKYPLQDLFQKSDRLKSYARYFKNIEIKERKNPNQFELDL
jgi:hypothetical protein